MFGGLLLRHFSTIYLTASRSPINLVKPRLEVTRLLRFLLVDAVILPTSAWAYISLVSLEAGFGWPRLR